MMSRPSVLLSRACLALLAVCLAGGHLLAADIKLEALLVWATNDGSSPKPEHRPIDPDLKKKFENMPFKWKNYFEEKRVPFSIATNAYTKVEINNTCYFDVKDLGECRVKVKLYGKNKEVIRHEKPLPDGETLIFAGDDKNDHSQSAWFIVIRHNKAVAATAPAPAPAKPAGK
jgi:hypothetical protein